MVTVLRATTVKLQTRSLASVETAFPFLQDATNSDPHLPTKHAPADVVDVAAEEECSVFQLLDRILIHFPEFWDAEFIPFKKAGATCNAESEALFVVAGIFRAVIEGLELTNEIDFALNRTL